MALIRRIARLFKADMHGILEQLEDPRAVLAQAVRDMEAEIEKNQTALREQTREIEHVERRKTECSKRIDEINAQIQLCLKQSDETLAKSAIRRRLEMQAAARAAAQKAETLAKETANLQLKIKDQQKQLQSVREKMSILSESTVRAGVVENCFSDVCVTDMPGSVSDEEVQIAYLAEMERLNTAAVRK